jgi:hypothetical protein
MIKKILEQHFINLELSATAQLWLYDLWDVLQGLDDWRDRKLNVVKTNTISGASLASNEITSSQQKVLQNLHRVL